MLKSMLACTSVAALSLCLGAGAAHAEKIKLAYIDGLSGPFAKTGQDLLREVQFAVETLLNGTEVAGEKLEVEVLALDGQTNPKDSQIQLQNAISQGARFVMHSSGSHVAHALVDFLNKHNARNPDQRAIYLNIGAVDPALTNAACSFWHFRMDPHADMKLSTIAEVISQDSDVKSVYIIGQDYSFGKAVSEGTKKFLAEKRPDIQIVGDELHPIGKVKDFTPYAQKIKSSGADAIVTGNYSADMTNLAKAIIDIGIDAKIYTFYGSGAGISATLGAAAKDRVFVVGEGHINPPRTAEWESYIKAYDAKYDDSDFNIPRIAHTVQMLGAAMQNAGSTDPVKVARALEGLEFTTMAGDKVVMRAEDHQILMPIQISVHTNEGVTFDYDGSGFATVTSVSVPAEKTVMETTCKMERPE
jgi:branched-chain amino acid transport system substrate-binding protein